MTNEEIIKIAASKFSVGNPVVLEAVASAAVLMKDKQFKEYLEKKRDKWQSAYEETQDSDYYAVYDIIDELLGGEK